MNIGSALVGSLELVDNATPKLVAFDQQLHRTFGAFAQFQEHSRIVGIGLQQFGSHIARTGDRLTMLSAGVVATGAAVAKLSIDFQTNMTKIANLTDIGVKGVGQMRAEILKMGPQVAQGPIALSEALYSIGSVGLTGAKAIETLNVSAKAAAVGLGETKDVARAVSAAVINYGNDGMTAARATDILLAAVREGGAEADEFAKGLGRVIATAKTLGISFEEVTASIATFTRLGVRADEAVTALRGTMAFLMKPSAGVKEQLKELGLTIEDVRKKVREDGLAAALIDIVQRADKMGVSIGQIIPNVRALAGVLANAGSQSKEYREILERLKNSTGSLDAAFENLSQTAGFKLAQAFAKLQTIGVRLGDSLLPAIVSLIDAMTPLLEMLGKLVSAFEFLPGPVKAAAGAFLLFSISIGPILSVGGRMIEVVGLLTRLFSGLKTAIFGVTTATDLYTAATERSFKAAVAARTATAAAAPIITDIGLTTAGDFRGARFTLPQRAQTLAFKEQAELLAKLQREAAKNANEYLEALNRIRRETSSISGLLGAATAPLATYNLGWSLAKDSTGNFAKQLLAVNPIIRDNVEILGRAVATSGPFHLFGTRIQSVVSETVAGNREIIRLSNTFRALPPAIEVTSSALIHYTDIISGTARGYAGLVDTTLRLGTTLKTLPPVVEATNTALVLYNRSLLAGVSANTAFTISTIATGASVNALYASMAAPGFKLLTDGAKTANAALIPFAATTKNVGSGATQAAASTRLLAGTLQGFDATVTSVNASVGLFAVTLAGIVTAFGVIGAASAIVVGKFDELKATVNLIPGVFKDLLTSMKNAAVIWVETFNIFRDTAEKTTPFLFASIGNWIQQQLDKFTVMAVILNELARRSGEFGEKLRIFQDKGEDVNSILKEAQERRMAAERIGVADAARIAEIAEKNRNATEKQRQDLNQLIKTWEELKTTTYNSGNGVILSLNQISGVTDVVIEKFKKFKQAGLEIPREIEIAIKIQDYTKGLFEGVGKRMFEGSAEEEAARRLEIDTGEIRRHIDAVNDAIKNLTPKQVSDFRLALSQADKDIPKLAERYKGLFGGSVELATSALKKLGAKVSSSMATAKRETGWIENLRIEAVQLEAKLKDAYESNVPINMIMEAFGSNIKNTTGKLQGLGKELHTYTTRGLADLQKFELEEPFRKIEKHAIDVNNLAQRMLESGMDVAQVYELLGDSAVTAGEKAKAIGSPLVFEALNKIKQKAEDIKLDEIFARYDEALVDFQRSIAKTSATPQEIEELTAVSYEWVDIAKERVQVLKQEGGTTKEVNREIREQQDRLRDLAQGYTANMKAIRESQYAIEDYQRAFAPDTIQNRIEDINISFKRQREQIVATERDAVNFFARMIMSLVEQRAAINNATEAWVRNGALTRGELGQLATFATARFDILRKSGLFAAEEIEKAWHTMVELNIRAQDQWAAKFMEAVASMPDVISKAFATMLQEAESFKDLFVGIWKSIQNALTNVFADIVQTFIRQVLQRMLASILGAKNAFAGGLAGLLGGAAPGSGQQSGLIGQLLGGMGGAAVGGPNIIPGVGGGPPGIPVINGIPPGTTFGAPGFNWGAFAGGGLMAGAGAAQWFQAGSNKVGNLLGGAMTGAGIGTMIMPGIGTAIGAGIGAIAGAISGAFRKPESKKIMEQIGRDLGVNISEGLAKEIEELAKTIEGGTKNQRRALAEILSLDKIIEEGGGLNANNVQQYQMLAFQLFKPIKEGSKQAGLATEQLNTLVGKFAAQADKTGGLWSATFKEIIARAKEMGLELENVTAALNAQMDKLASGLDKLTAGFEATIKKDFTKLLKGTGLEEAADELWEAFGDPEKMTEVMEGMKDKFVEEFEKKFKNIPELDDAAEAIFGALGDPSKLDQVLDRLDLDKKLEAKVREFAGSFDIWTILLGGADKLPAAMEQVKARFITEFESNFKDIPELDKVGEQIWEAIGDPEKLERVIDRLDLKKDIEKKVREFVDAFDIDKALKEVSLGEFTKKAQVQFDRLSRIAFASFNAMIKQGKSAVEAIDAIGASVDRLISIHDKLGLKGSAAYDALARFRNLVKDNRELVDAASGLNDVMVTLSNLGGMTADIFADLQGETGTIFEQLKAAGFSTNEALSIMAPSLQTLIDLAEKYGFKIDDATQAIIDQAREAGILKDKQLSTNDILMMGFTAMIEALGGELPQAFKDFAEEAKRRAQEVSDALDKATKDRDVDVDVKVHMPGPDDIEIDFPEYPEGDDRRRYSTGGIVGYAAGGFVANRHGALVGNYATGGMVESFRNVASPTYLQEGGPSLTHPKIIRFVPRGTDTVPAMLTPGELVLNAAQQRNLAEDLTRPQGSPVNINISLEGANIRNPQDATEIGIALAKEMRRNPRVRQALGEQIINIQKQNRTRVA